ncbi:MAG: SulP family inorganic anion transporter [Gammaproteobacteria bacterium]|nr:SulP family inorganic anion transporter [Gammaproteobacteria bacterium]
MQSNFIPLWLVRYFPFLKWRHRVNRESLRADLWAGFTGAIVVLPQGVAFATIAGMPPEYGLYAGMIPAIIAALFGSSWHLVSGPTTAASIVLFSALSVFAEPGSQHYVSLALTLTLMVGSIQLLMGIARLGTLVNFISHSVVIGFTAGAAILIAFNQAKHFFGIKIPSGSHFYDVIWALIQQYALINPYVVTVGALTMVAGLLAKRWLKSVPYMIVAILFGTAVALILNALFGGEAVTGIKTVGALPASLPPLSAPDLSLDTLKMLAPAAFAATLFALTEAVSIARSLASRAGQHIDGNQEFIGQGLSNIAGSFFSGYVATGSFNRSGLNYEAGARTPLAAVFAGSFLIIVVLLVAPWAAYLPNAAMAGILFLVAWGLIDFHHISRIIKTSRAETMVLATTFFSTLFLELEFAILLGVILSLGVYLSRTSRPRVFPRVPNPVSPKRSFVTNSELDECPQMKAVHVDGSLFFGAVAHVRESLMQFQKLQPQQSHMLVSASAVNFIDIAGAELLTDEAKRLRAAKGGLYLVGVKDSVCRTLNAGGYADEIGRENIFEHKKDAIAEIVHKRLDPQKCATCAARIFEECKSMPKPH